MSSFDLTDVSSFGLDKHARWWKGTKSRGNNTNVSQGPITGIRVVTLSPLSENKTKVDVLWSIDMSGIPFFAKGFVKDGFMKRTEQALDKLTQAAVP